MVSRSALVAVVAGEDCSREQLLPVLPLATIARTSASLVDGICGDVVLRGERGETRCGGRRGRKAAAGGGEVVRSIYNECGDEGDAT